MDINLNYAVTAAESVIPCDTHEVPWITGKTISEHSERCKHENNATLCFKSQNPKGEHSLKPKSLFGISEEIKDFLNEARLQNWSTSCTSCWQVQQDVTLLCSSGENRPYSI